ncbi:DUF6323 family protein [Gemmiger sp.]|uniref:DUF6323 family protein n=1 Tax=Gemmiger sp. TaxID=2049027 RepID=UPI003F0BE52F
MPFTDLIFMSQDPARTLQTVNAAGESRGLALTAAEAKSLAAAHGEALHRTGRVEIGPGALPLLAQTFADSPYADPRSWAELLGQLQDVFYELKNLTRDRLADEALAKAMRILFDGPCGGDAGALEAVTAEQLAAAASGRSEREEGQADD